MWPIYLAWKFSGFSMCPIDLWENLQDRPIGIASINSQWESFYMTFPTIEKNSSKLYHFFNLEIDIGIVING